MNSWIDVNDKLPPDKHEVLCFSINDAGTKEIIVAYRDKGFWKNSFIITVQRYLLNFIITHWMELPEYSCDE